MMNPMTRLVLASFLALGVVSADAAPKKKYHFELTAVTPKPAVKPDVAKAAQPRVELQVKKAFTEHPQLVPNLDGAPDPKNADAYRAYLAKKGLSGSYLVTVEITEATEELVPMEGKGNSQRFVVHIGLHMLGEEIPGRTMAFTGDGQATVKLEVGKKMRDKDREYSWDGAAETAVKDAIEQSLKHLAMPKIQQHN